MPKKRVAAPMSEVEKAFHTALDRLKEGKPNNPDLAKKAKLGKLRINTTTVALEAGGRDSKTGKWRTASRSQIGHAKCRYPRVRAAILGLKIEPEGVPTRQDELNRKLRTEIQALRMERDIARSQMAAMIRRMDQVDKEVENRIKHAKREVAAKYRKADVNQVAAARLLQKESATLIPFPDPSARQAEVEE
jgi:hypothetical protein